MDIKNYLKELIIGVLEELDFKGVNILLEHPVEMVNGDYATPVALQLAKEKGLEPKKIAENIKEKLEELRDENIAKIEVAGPGFINFYLSEKFWQKSLGEIMEQGDKFGQNERLQGQRIIIEYTDPNPFKKFHIGHLMSNAVGESLSRLIEMTGAQIKRANYQGDVGLHVAKAIWAKLEGRGELADGSAYAVGAEAYEDDVKAKEEIEDINRKIYEGADADIKEVYEQGKRESLAEFNKMYEKLGTKFDFSFMESEVIEEGRRIVEDNKGRVFEESEGAIVFRGEKVDPKLHTRVFINSQGLPTYETKELGLAKIKSEKYPYDESIVVTANEVDVYFMVVLAVMKKIWPELAEKTKHVSHGILKMPEGKMSSRTGKVLEATEIITKVETEMKGRLKGSDFDNNLWEKIAEPIAIGAIKYSILKQAPGKDIVFDFDKSLSLEGDSGPYLQYTYARINSVLEKAKKEGIKPSWENNLEINEVVRMLPRFTEIVELAGKEYMPQYVATYLHNLASAFNSYYAQNKIVGEGVEFEFRVALAQAVGQVLKNGLWVLGIKTVVKM